MKYLRLFLFTAVGLGALLVAPKVFSHAGHATACPETEIYCQLIDHDDNAGTVIDSLTMPELTDPAWTKPKVSPSRGQTTVTYQVETRGTVGSSLESFAALAAQTYADSRGWSRLGAHFERVQKGGQFTLILTQSSLMTSFSSGCDTTYSCNVGNYVLINNDRWQGATPSWNQAGGTLRDYRHMVINHETGHWLGHGHSGCRGAGQAAPVMQQQSIDLQGCRFNPWPLDSELYAPKIGI